MDGGRRKNSVCVWERKKQQFRKHWRPDNSLELNNWGSRLYGLEMEDAAFGGCRWLYGELMLVGVPSDRAGLRIGDTQCVQHM